MNHNRSFSVSVRPSSKTRARLLIPRATLRFARSDAPSLMPFQYVLDSHRRMARIRMWDVITRAEVMTVRQQLAADPGFTEDFSELIDLQGLTSLDQITANDVRALAASEVERVQRRAFVTRDPVTFGLARMFQSHHSMSREAGEVQVFGTVEEAEAWLVDDRP